MPQAAIDCLIINSPYQEPRRHWRYDRETRLFGLGRPLRAWVCDLRIWRELGWRTC